eukprot:TRINITY_DN1625_c0_g7_i1.p1 TRINITY_DN1625_c0_g7~~TRINITY_DN1625_c0_g7_i1.p1  ORF type:complete len:125 (+),score=1.23 TRINITY_DN1625_c0_g7_i1:143-517(+)
MRSLWQRFKRRSKKLFTITAWLAPLFVEVSTLFSYPLLIWRGRRSSRANKSSGTNMSSSMRFLVFSFYPPPSSSFLSSIYGELLLTLSLHFVILEGFAQIKIGKEKEEEKTSQPQPPPPVSKEN